MKSLEITPAASVSLCWIEQRSLERARLHLCIAAGLKWNSGIREGISLAGGDAETLRLHDTVLRGKARVTTRVSICRADTPEVLQVTMRGSLDLVELWPSDVFVHTRLSTSSRLP